MLYGIWILLCLLVLGGIGIWFAFRHLKKKRRQIEFQRNVPQDVLNDFNYAEQQMKGGLKEDGTTTSPYQILWDISKQRRVQSIAGNNRAEQAIISRELYQQPSGRQDIQTRTIAKPVENKPIVGKAKRNNLQSFVSRIRRVN